MMWIFWPVFFALLSARFAEVFTLAAINYFRELNEYKKILRDEAAAAKNKVADEQQ